MEFFLKTIYAPQVQNSKLFSAEMNDYCIPEEEEQILFHTTEHKNCQG